MVKAIIFDVDGTLIDSVDAHAQTWREAFAAFGHDIPLADLRGQIGKGGDQLMPVFLDANEVKAQGDALNERRAAILKERYLDGLAAFPQTRALFEAIRRRGIRIALASSAAAEELQVYERKAEIADLVEKRTSSSDAERSKPHGDIFQAALDRLEGIEPTDALVVGDTPYDAEAAAKVGLRTVGVLCGGFPEADLRAAGCIALFRDPGDLLDRLDEVLGPSVG